MTPHHIPTCWSFPPFLLSLPYSVNSCEILNLEFESFGNTSTRVLSEKLWAADLWIALIYNPFHFNWEGEQSRDFLSVSEYFVHKRLQKSKYHINILISGQWIYFRPLPSSLFKNSHIISKKYSKKLGRNLLNYIIKTRCCFRLRQNYSKTPFSFVNASETREKELHLGDFSSIFWNSDVLIFTISLSVCLSSILEERHNSLGGIFQKSSGHIFWCLNRVQFK